MAATVVTNCPLQGSGEAICVAYMSPMNFRPLYPAFASEIGEKSAPVVGLNDIFGSFDRSRMLLKTR